MLSDSEEDESLGGEEDWNDVFDDDSHDVTGDENVNPNIRPEKSASKTHKLRSSRMKTPLK